MLVAVKPAADAVKSHRVEKTRVSQPDNGITIISAIRYAVCTQLISSWAAESPPPMFCREDATIWISNSAMNPPKHITTNGNRPLTQLSEEASLVSTSAILIACLQL